MGSTHPPTGQFLGQVDPCESLTSIPCTPPKKIHEAFFTPFVWGKMSWLLVLEVFWKMSFTASTEAHIPLGWYVLNLLPDAALPMALWLKEHQGGISL